MVARILRRSMRDGDPAIASARHQLSQVAQRVGVRNSSAARRERARRSSAAPTTGAQAAQSLVLRRVTRTVHRLAARAPQPSVGEQLHQKAKGS